VLTHQEMALVQAARDAPGNELTWMQHAERVVHGVDNVPAEDLHGHASVWEKIVQWCTI
jgi:hypothetical protein